MSAWWDDERTLCLLTPQEYLELADGTVLTAIDGETMVKGTNQLDDDDTRFGHLAWGVTEDHPLRLALLARTKLP